MADLRDFARRFVAEMAKDREGPYLTATGVDENTDVEEILRWGLMDLELAFLYSARWEGQAKRYPPLDFILETARGIPTRTALHVCGGPAKKALVRGELDIEPFERVQINGVIRVPEVKDICLAYPDKTFILQYQGPGDDFFLTYDAVDNLAMLVDASGGNGILPDSWEDLESIHPVGFAGGLNHENMEEQVRAIREVAEDGWWVDLESGLRDEEWFSNELLRWSHQAFCRGLRSTTSAW